MQPDELRTKYLEFFKKRGHSIVPSSSLVPENDPTTLFTGSGMQPMIEYLLGSEHPKGTRIVDSQKCFRSQDIEEVGDNSHTTFFEMLGNWSLGDYFKEEQLAWFFEFLTNEVQIDPNKLYVTAYEGNSKIGVPKDSDTPKIWKELFAKFNIDAKVVSDSEENGMQEGRIFYYGDGNWWSRAGAPTNMPAGEPGGPDSEVFYDFGIDKKFHENSNFKDQVCHVNCDCGRFLEIGNSVFMQYQKQADGSFIELAQKNVDFGGGFERILAVKHNTDDVFLTPLFTPIISFLEELSGKKYSDEKTKQSFRVIADHMRAATMLAADGVYPSNKEQGYFARRLVRRAIRYAKMIGIEQVFIGDLVKVIINIYKKSYPSVIEHLDRIVVGLSTEETKFAKTLQKGLREVEKVEKLTGEVAFKLYETYGFPFELTAEIAAEKGQIISQEEFDNAKKDHSFKSRTASAGKFKGGLQDSSEQTTRYHTATHLLHAALRQVLGDHVQQKGSNITGERLRFDFSHSQAMTDLEKSEVQKLIKQWVDASLPVTFQSMPKEKALKSGAIAFFVEKYPDEVTVYTIGEDPSNNWISKEFCGGPHVKNTAEIGSIELFKEKAASAGIRRVYLR
jgi:alanyl-tRNA synthetase